MQVFKQVAEPAVLDPVGLAMQYQEARLIAPGRRRVRD
jgi:hydroxyethylthiazole kinase-like sugar kinase family protein